MKIEKCKNCGHRIRKIVLFGKGEINEYVHIDIGFAPHYDSKVCESCGCTNPEPLGVD